MSKIPSDKIYTNEIPSANSKLTTIPQVLTVLLPVHNRGSLTADFVLHLNNLLPDGMNLKVVIFDDGCTDETLVNVKRAWPDVRVVKLNGMAFWGGAMNEISKYIRLDTLSEESLYLLANDDIRFPSKLAFMAGLREVDRGALVCAQGLRVKNLNDYCHAHIQNNRSEISQGLHYNPKTGNIEKATFAKPVNISGTHAMLTTKEAWLSAPAIPTTIPHYLSDYWFTYKLVLKGYRIVHPAEFICFESAQTSRCGNEPPGGKKSWLKAKADYLQSSIDIAHPSYIPAWIEFLSQKPVYPSVRVKIVKLKVQQLAANFLYGRNVKH